MCTHPAAKACFGRFIAYVLILLVGSGARCELVKPPVSPPDWVPLTRARYASRNGARTIVPLGCGDATDRYRFARTALLPGGRLLNRPRSNRSAQQVLSPHFRSRRPQIWSKIGPWPANPQCSDLAGVASPRHPLPWIARAISSSPAWIRNDGAIRPPEAALWRANRCWPRSKLRLATAETLAKSGSWVACRDRLGRPAPKTQSRRAKPMPATFYHRLLATMVYRSLVVMKTQEIESQVTFNKMVHKKRRASGGPEPPSPTPEAWPDRPLASRGQSGPAGGLSFVGEKPNRIFDYGPRGNNPGIRCKFFFSPSPPTACQPPNL